MKKIKAHQIAQKNIIIDKNCEKCGSNKNLIRHHNDYDKPLEVKILCKKCHRNWHINNKAINKDDIGIEFILRFRGNKTELHKQLKIWCAESDKTMNGTIIELIEKHLKKTKIIN